MIFYLIRQILSVFFIICFDIWAFSLVFSIAGFGQRTSRTGRIAFFCIPYCVGHPFNGTQYSRGYYYIYDDLLCYVFCDIGKREKGRLQTAPPVYLFCCCLCLISEERIVLHRLVHSVAYACYHFLVLRIVEHFLYEGCYLNHEVFLGTACGYCRCAEANA